MTTIYVPLDLDFRNKIANNDTRPILSLHDAFSSDTRRFREGYNSALSNFTNVLYPKADSSGFSVDMGRLLNDLKSKVSADRVAPRAGITEDCFDEFYDDLNQLEGMKSLKIEDIGELLSHGREPNSQWGRFWVDRSMFQTTQESLNRLGRLIYTVRRGAYDHGFEHTDRINMRALAEQVSCALRNAKTKLTDLVDFGTQKKVVSWTPCPDPNDGEMDLDVGNSAPVVWRGDTADSVPQYFWPECQKRCSAIEASYKDLQSAISKMPLTLSESPGTEGSSAFGPSLRYNLAADYEWLIEESFPDFIAKSDETPLKLSLDRWLIVERGTQRLASMVDTKKSVDEERSEEDTRALDELLRMSRAYQSRFASLGELYKTWAIISTDAVEPSGNA